MRITKRINFFYNLKQIINKLQAQKLTKFSIEDNLFILNNKQTKIKSILLYLDDEKMMHLGDHLFFEPLAKYLKLSGFKLSIYPTKIMKFYFEDLGYEIDNDKKLSKYDLIISCSRVYEKLKKIKNQTLLINTTSSKIKLPICDDIVHKVSRFLRLKEPNGACIPSFINCSLDRNKFPFFKTNEKYIIFNNYIDSGTIRSGASHQILLIKFIKKLKVNTGFKIIHTGSRHDKAYDSRKYDFVDFDIRGKCALRDIFALCEQKNVIYNVSFDSFQMHLFFILNKKSFILFRGRLIKKNEDFIKKYVNPPFKEPRSEYLIEYIEDSRIPLEQSLIHYKPLKEKKFKDSFFSIIIPCYNGEKFIERCIKSVKKQTYKKFEVLFIDDGSSDRSYEVFKKNTDVDSRFRIISHKKNLGLSASRNTGIMHSKGEFIAFLDIDDWWPKSKLSVYLNYFLNGSDLIFSDYTRVNGKKKKKVTVIKNISFKMLLVSNLIPVSSSAFNQKNTGTKFFKYKSPSEDWLFWLDLIKLSNKPLGIPKNLMFYNVSNDSMSANKLIMAKRAWYIFRDYHRFSLFISSYYFLIYFIRGFKVNYL